MTENLATRLLDICQRQRGACQTPGGNGQGLWCLAAGPPSHLEDGRQYLVGLQLGTSICAPHLCQHCGMEGSACGTHGLNCWSSEGRHPRHAAINDIIHRTLSSAGLPSQLELPGLSRSDGKRPDGMSHVPWSSGRPLVWDATCPGTFATSH